MKNGFIHHSVFKKSKRCLCRSQLCVICFAVVCMFLLMHIYDNFRSTSQLTYQHKQNIKESKIILPPSDLRRENAIVSQLEKVYNKVEQKVKLPAKPDDVNENNISSQKDNNEQKENQKENQNSNQNTNQQNIVKLPDNPGNMIEIKPPSHKEVNGRLDRVNQSQIVPGMNATHINGILMEPVKANYTRNIYFTIKTTHKYYTKRLFPLMLTWFQVVDKDKLSIISDRAATEKIYVDMFRKAGFQIIDSAECPTTHSRWGLCCKMGTEFAAYYKAVEEHPGEEERYQWFCHADDDVYINVPKLSRFLQQYDPRKPYYVGKWPYYFYPRPTYGANNHTIYHFRHDLHLPLKRTEYQYATGSTFCISYPIMMEAKRFINGAKPFNKMSVSALPRIPDDMTVGLVIGGLLGHNLTDAANMTNEYDVHVHKADLKELTRYLTISSGTAVHVDSLDKLASSLKTPLPSADPTRFLLYHCLLYPAISWCNSVRETLNTNVL